ncbi:MAG: hypothetical protein KGJ57_03185 [Sphingomonadales bacterium]|nr:hypothetical protein [Sphingomonadales bacterium]MDE2168413.1 hypothetical protein [Sphingomonadales bacterium]
MDSNKSEQPAGSPRDDAPWSAPAPRWFWLVVGLCCLWNLLGAADYTLTNLRVAPYMAQMPPAMIRFIEQLPYWVVGAWALGVWGSVVGSLLMLMRVRHAAIAYALSFAGAVGALTWEYAHGAQQAGGGFAPMAALLLVAILFQLWFSRQMFWRGVLR